MRSAIDVWRQANRASLTANNKQGGALAAATAVIQSYGDEREAKGRAEAIAEVVAWLRVQQHGRTSDNYPGYYARQIEAGEPFK